MNKYTDEEIKQEVVRLWAGRRYYDSVSPPDKIAVVQNDKEVRITLSNMYEAPGLGFKQLMGLAKFFNTMHVNDDDRFAETGCETCDYGSSYGFTLTIRDGEPFKEP